MPIIGLLRIRNEARWIAQVVRSLAPIGARIIVRADFSAAGTADICEAEGCTVHRSAVPWVETSAGLVSDESAGKDFLLSKAFEHVPKSQLNASSEYFALAIDGDEVLADGDGAILQAATASTQHVLSLKILYLWDRLDQVRVDGVYGRFARPSMFRLMNPNFRYQRTPFGNGANFHCSSIPQEMLHHSAPSEARLLHLGYLHREDRLRKWEFYNRIDPGNRAEDCYRHCVQGDLPEIPAGARLMHAGPLQFATL